MGELTVDLFMIKKISRGDLAVTEKETLTKRLNDLSPSGNLGTFFSVPAYWDNTRSYDLRMHSQGGVRDRIWEKSARPRGE